MKIVNKTLRNLRYNAVKKYLEGDVLDLGCGSGIVAKGISSRQRYIGLDRVAWIGYYWKNQKFPIPENITFCMCDIAKDDFPEGDYSTIVMTAVLEHLPQPDVVISKCASVLKRGGSLIITTPSPWSDGVHNFLSRIGILSRFAEEEHEDLLGYEDVKALFNKRGFRLQNYSKFMLGFNQLFVFKKV